MFYKYLKEREGFDTLEITQGFITYKITGDECYIRDIYVSPEYRKDGVASCMADNVVKIAKEQGCRWLVGSISPDARASHASMLVLVAYGMKITKAEKDIVFFSKEI